MAFAGLATWFIERLKAATRTRPNHPIACLIVLIARCILSYIEYLFKMAVIMVAITGQSFGNSGLEIGRLFWKSFGNMVHSAGVWMFPGRILGTLNFVMALALGAAYGGAAYHPTKKDCENDAYEKVFPCDQDSYDNQDGDCLTCSQLATSYSILAGFAIFFIVLFLLSLFAGILLTILDTTFICFLLDKDAGVVTKPQFHKIFGDVLSYRAKFIKQPATPPKPPSYLAGEVAPRYTVQTSASPNPNPPTYSTAPGGGAPPQTTYGTSPPPQGNPYYAQPPYPQQPPPTQGGFDPMTGQPYAVPAPQPGAYQARKNEYES
jgi:hypothetical protein